MYFISLRSGSYGNGYLISDGSVTLMFDAGVPKSLVQKVLHQLNIPAPAHIFISHEHTDHIKNIDVLTRAFHTDVEIIITQGTADAISLPDAAITIVSQDAEICVNGFCVCLVPIPHDATEPVGFLVKHTSGASAAIISDIGHPAEETISAVAGANVILIEANYDSKMLKNGDYPEFIKLRIAGKYGHLSNSQCCQFLNNFLHPELKMVILGHISENNNSSELALSCVRRQLPVKIPVLAASRYVPKIVHF